MTEQKSLRIYGCGGAGVNVANYFYNRDVEEGCAKLMPAIVDTSKANLKGSKIPTSDSYLVDGLDGSGKIRAENHLEIARTIKQVLVDIPPQDFNVVVFSASGGSGSVIGPLLISEMNDQKIPVMAIVIGSDESVISAENTLKTLQSLESISVNTAVPTVMSYHYNDLDVRRSAVDASIYNVIGCLAILTSGSNREMDYRDLVHWLHYTKTNGGASHLTTLHIVTKQDDYDKLTNVVSIASLYNNPDQPQLRTSADYHTVGYTDLNSISMDELHFAISTGDIAKIGADIKERVNQMMKTRAARIDNDSLLGDAKPAAGSGLIL